MRVVVTGTQGQVARALVARGGLALGRPVLDLAWEGSIAPALAAARPDVVVNAAAYTAVDRAEDEEALAHVVNARGAGAVAAGARALGVPVIHISSDYVFDGTKGAPYAEDDAPAPLGAYGRSKLAGEHAVLAAHPGAVVLRTAWVFSPHGANFVKTMLRLAQTRGQVGVVADQWGNPTSADDLADAVMAIARRLHDEPDAAPRGVFHASGGGAASWADLAQAVFDHSAAHGGPVAQVRSITTADYPTPAPRPADTRLDGARLLADYGVALPPWREAVGDVVARLLQERAPA